jgi:hypothetical protein
MTTFKLSSLAQAVRNLRRRHLFAGSRRAADQGRQGHLRPGQGLGQGGLRHRQEGLRFPERQTPRTSASPRAKAKRVRVDENAEAAYKNTPKAREHAAHEIAEADYNVAKERCDDKAGNEKDICVKEAKAAMTRSRPTPRPRRRAPRPDGRQQGQDGRRLQGGRGEVRLDVGRREELVRRLGKARYHR